MKPQTPSPVRGMVLALMAAAAMLLSTTMSALEQTPNELSVEAIHSRVEAIAATFSEGETDPDLSATLDAARAALASGQQFEEERNQYVQIVETGEETLKALEAELKELAALLGERGPSPSQPVSEVRLIELESLRAAAELERSALRSRISTITERPRMIATRLIELRAERDANRTTSMALPAEADLQAQASRAFETATQVEREKQILALQTELETLAVRERILAQRIDIERRRLVLLDDAIEERREWLRDSDLQAAIKLVQDAEALSPTNRHRDSVLELAHQVRNLVERGYQVQAATTTYRELSSKLDTDRATVERIINVGTANGTLGGILERIRNNIPSQSRLRADLTAIEHSQLDLASMSIIWRDRLAEENFSGGPGEALLREALQSAIAAARPLDETLSEHRTAIAETLQQSLELKKLLDRRLLWLPTSDVFSVAWLTAGASGFATLLAPDKWRAALQELGAAAKAQPLFFLLYIGLVLAAWGARSRLRQGLKVLSGRVHSVSRDSILTTPNAVLLTVLIALPFPFFVSGLGFALLRGDELFSQALGAAFLATSTVLFSLVLFRQMSTDQGVFAAHFGWSDQSRTALRRHLSWFAVVSSLSTFLFVLALASGNVDAKYGPGMMAFIAASVAISVFAYYFLKPNGGIATAIMIASGAAGWQLPVLLLFVLLPLLIGLLPLLGYFDTAVEIQGRLFRSGLLLLATTILYELLIRTFEVPFRRLARKRATKRAETRRAASDDEAVETVDGSVLIEEQEIDLAEISGQTRRVFFYFSMMLLAFGLWSTWQPVVAALGIADAVVLWQGVTYIDGVEVNTAVTVMDLVYSILIVAISFAAARNLRGVLEISLFDRLEMSSGERYAVTSLIAYVVVTTGLIVSLAKLGVDWSKLQWILAALGVGLGFGLQEIVANFISGLIILFERPVRVGDTISIGDVSGTVTNISIRATTVTNWDNFEVLLPNKTIITENVTNWTKNNQVTRLLIHVGVAYGSDIAKVRKLISEVVAAHPQVLDEPAYSVLFMNHGESSLDFEIRAFVPTPDYRLITTHELNAQINTALAEADIEIPFPQRDIHLRS